MRVLVTGSAGMLGAALRESCPSGVQLAIAHAPPLAKNGHKVPMTSAAVERALLRLVR